MPLLRLRQFSCNSLKVQNKKAGHILKHVIAQNIYHHSKGKKRRHNEEILDHSKTKTQQGKLQTLHLYAWCQSTLQISNSSQFWWLKPTSFSWLFPVSVSSSPQQASYSSDISSILGSSRSSPLQLHTLGLHRDTPATCWPQQLYLAQNGDSTTPFLYPWPQSQNHLAKAAKFYLLGWNVGLVQMHFHQLSIFDCFLHCQSLAVLCHS